MAYDRVTEPYRAWYAKLLRFYPAAYYQRFGEGMEQTFNDLCREQKLAQRGVTRLVLWMFVETCIGIIRENIIQITMENMTRRLGMWAILVAALLMIPWFANWPWSGGDFVFATVLLFGSATVFELIARKARTSAHKLAMAAAVGTPLLLIWVNGAVGLIGSEDNDANILYLGVVVVEIIGVLLARLRPQGMARALFVTAILQFIVPFVALIFWPSTFSEPPGIVGVFTLNTFFAVLFAGSGILFQHASTMPGTEPKQSSAKE